MDYNINPEKILKNYWHIDSFRFMGRYSVDKCKTKSRFEDIRDLNGDLLYFPFIENTVFKGGKVIAYSNHTFKLEEGEYYQFDADFYFNAKPKFLVEKQPIGKVKLDLKNRLAKEELVNKIFKDTIPNETVAKNQANAIKKVTEDAYEEDDRFIFELIQNADDSGDDNNLISLHFHFIENYLLIQHNGKAFTDEDVKAITGIGHSSEEKTESNKKTGYKGIGFKSVFLVSDNVSIISGDYAFQFSKDHRFIKESKIPEDLIPWEILPIWFQRYRLTKFLIDKVNYNKTQTNFIIELKSSSSFSPEKVYSDAVSIFQQPKFSLFLRNTSTLNLSKEGQELAISKNINEEASITDLLINEELDSSWIIYDRHDIDVPQEVTKSMLDDSSIPAKLKKSKYLNLSFAVKLHNDKIIALSENESVLFTYLPTTVHDYKFPYLVNSDFLTILNRQSIKISKPWNIFIFEQIGYLQFLMAVSIYNRNDEFSNSFLKILKAPYTERDESTFKGFNDGVSKALTNLAFIPDKQKVLRKIDEIIIDTTGITQILSIEEFSNFFNIERELIHHEITLPSWLRRTVEIHYPSSVFEIDILLIYFGRLTEWLKDLNNNIKFLKLVIKNNWFSKFERRIFLLDRNNSLRTLSEVYLSIPDEDISILSKMGVAILHPEIDDLLKENQNEFTKVFTAQEVLKNKCGKINSCRNKDLLIEFYNFLSRYIYNLNERDQDLIRNLQSVPIFGYDNRQIWRTRGISVFIASARLKKALDYDAFPKNILSVIDGDLYGINDRPSHFWEKIGIYKIADNSDLFIKENILYRISEIFNYYEGKLKQGLTAELVESNRLMWEFLFSIYYNISLDLRDKYLTQMGNLPVFTSKGELKQLRQCMYVTKDILLENSLWKNIGGNWDIIHQDYITKSTYPGDIKTEYLRFGAKPYNDKSIFNEVINFAANFQNDNDEIHFHLIKLLIPYYDNNYFSKEHFDKLANFCFRTISNDSIKYHHPDKIHFSKEYKPIIELEEYCDSISDSIFLLSPEYLDLGYELNNIKEFFKKFGVSESFNYKSVNASYYELKSSKYIQSLYNSNQFSDTLGHLKEKFNDDEKIKKFTSISNHIVFHWLDEKLIQKYNSEFIKFLIANINDTDLYRHTILSNGFKFEFYNSLRLFLWNNRCIKNQNGQFCKVQDLFSLKLQKIINDPNRIIGEDFTLYHHSNGKNLEELWWVKQELTHDYCIKLLSNASSSLRISDFSEFNFKSIIKIDKLSDEELEGFYLFNQLGKRAPVKSLNILGDFNIGLGKYPNLLHPKLSNEGFGDFFKLNKLEKSHFKPIYEKPKNENLKEKILEKLKYLAILENESDFSILLDAYSEKLESVSFSSVSRIIYSCDMVSPPITQTEKVFDIEDNHIYYVGSWQGTFSFDLYKYLRDVLFQIKKISVKILTDIIQQSHEEILSLLRSRNIAFPDEWNLEHEADSTESSDNTAESNSQSISSDEVTKIPPKKENSGILPGQSAIYEISDIEKIELEKLIGRSLLEHEMANSQLMATLNAITYYRAQGYAVEEFDKIKEKALKKRFFIATESATGKTINVLPRSAKSGFLMLKYSAWAKLANPDVELFVDTGNSKDDFIVFRDQKELANINQQPVISKIESSDNYSELKDLVSGSYLSLNKNRPLIFYFKLKDNVEYQSIFEKIMKTETDLQDFEDDIDLD
jgi:hypothetical protein